MELISTHPVLKSDLGFHGNLFGGQLLAWCDAAVAAYSMEVCHNRRMVTVQIDECVFKKSAKEGSLVKIYGELIRIGNTSATFAVEARAFNVYTHATTVILHTKMTFVRIDVDGNPIPISKSVQDAYREQDK